jgi:hypothetical protein
MEVPMRGLLGFAGCLAVGLSLSAAPAVAQDSGVLAAATPLKTAFYARPNAVADFAVAFGPGKRQHVGMASLWNDAQLMRAVAPRLVVAKARRPVVVASAADALPPERPAELRSSAPTEPQESHPVPPGLVTGETPSGPSGIGRIAATGQRFVTTMTSWTGKVGEFLPSL